MDHADVHILSDVETQWRENEVHKQVRQLLSPRTRSKVKGAHCYESVGMHDTLGWCRKLHASGVFMITMRSAWQPANWHNLWWSWAGSLKPSWRHRRLASFEKGPTAMAKALEKAAPKRFWKRPKPWHAFGKGLRYKKPLGKGPRTKLEISWKRLQTFEKGFETFGKEFEFSFTSRAFGKGFTCTLYRNQQGHKWPAGQTKQLMNNENEQKNKNAILFLK